MATLQLRGPAKAILLSAEGLSNLARAYTDNKDMLGMNACKPHTSVTGGTKRFCNVSQLQHTAMLLQPCPECGEIANVHDNFHPEASVV